MPTHISWTDETWNPTAGCSKVSAGCKNCYAIKEAHRLAGNPHPSIAGKYGGTTTEDGKNWTGAIHFDGASLEKPLHWKKPRRIFVNSMSDLFHESIPDEWIDRIFAVMALAPQHTFQVLTKRPERMRDYLTASDIRCRLECQPLLDDNSIEIGPSDWPLRNVWAGTSVEDQKTADERIPLLLQTPAAVRWISAEPLLGPVDLTEYLTKPAPKALRMLSRFYKGGDITNGAFDWLGTQPEVTRVVDPQLDWVVVGGESGTGARIFDVEWARSIISQCRAASVPVFVKQLGAQPVDWRSEDPEVPPYEFFLSDRKGGDINEWPEDLRVREYPNA